jgi:enoyl-CoA hydratase/carnithine racemase
MSKFILTKQEGSIAWIILNNPTKHNCMGMDMLVQLNDMFNTLIEDGSISIIVFRGAGEKSFSTGANLKEFNNLEGDEINNWIAYGNKLFDDIQRSPKPTVAYLNGYVMGGGFELALACDFRIGFWNTLISAPEVRNGWLPGWGAIKRLNFLFGMAKTKQIILRASKLSAQEADKLGLFSLYINEEKDTELVSHFLEELKGIRSEIYSLAKDYIQNQQFGGAFESKFDMLAAHYAKATD